MALKGKKSLSIRASLFFLLLAALLPILIIQGYIYYDRYDTRRAEELRVNLELAHAVGVAFTALVRDILHQEIALAIAATASPPLSEQHFVELLRRSAEDYQLVARFSWISPEGRVLASSDSDFTGFDISDRDYFREIVSGHEWVVSDLFSSKLGDELMFTISRAIRNRNGELLGLATATIHPNRLKEVLAVHRASDAGISLIDSKGMHVYRYPVTEHTLEQRNWLNAYPALEGALKGNDIATTIVSNRTGEKRLVGFAPIPSIGWVAAASRSEEDVMAAITSRLVPQGALFLVVTLLAFGFALALSGRISKSIMKLRNYALTLGQGEAKHLPEITHGPSEVEELADVFNDMARKVQFRERELRESEQRYKHLHAELELRVLERTAELESKNRELQEFAFVATHDMSEPLRKIQTFGSLLEVKSADLLDEQARDYVLRMVGSADRMRELLDALLRYSRLEMKGELRPTKLDKIAEDATTDLEVMIRKVGARVEIGQLPTVKGYPSQLRQLFQNLIANAVKYHRSGTKPLVRIFGEENNGDCRFIVEDNGIGFEERYVDKIFQPFQRLHGRDEYPGIGIGLTICRKIVERHGGTITAKSTPGQGSTFTVTLPCETEPKSDE